MASTAPIGSRMAEFRLETERLILRDWRDEDLPALYALCADPKVMATIGPLHDLDKTRGLLGRLQQRSVRDGHTFWAMERKQDGRVLGFCGVGLGTVPLLAQELEIGWRLASDCWGQSWAREAAEATLGWIAANRPDRPIWAITWAGNTRSRGLMERLGMRYLEDMDFEHPTVELAKLKPTVTYRLEAA
jgi:RimJ/RimL family protein N-acetyltransferase